MSNNHTDMPVASMLDFNGQRVVVTGANGFIGRRLVAGLIKANARVTVLLRSRHGRAHFEECGVNVIICQLKSGETLDNALTDQSILFHFAYDVRASGEANLAAFSALYYAANRARIQRFVHASSIVVYDDWPGGNITETAPITSLNCGDYRQAKIAMEAELLQADIPVAILQPTIVYGPGSALWTYAPQAALRRGPVVLPDPIGTCTAVYVDDVVRAALLAANFPDLRQEQFIITGPGTLTWADFYEGHIQVIKTGTIKLESIVSLTARLPRSPEATTNEGPSAAAWSSAILRHMIGSRRFDQITSHLRDRLPGGPVYPDRHMLELYAANPSVSRAYAHTRLGYKPVYDLEAGMAAIAQSDRR